MAVQIAIMLDCLLNYIGVKGCGLPEPESKLYINSLPGLTLKELQKIANSEQITFAGVWDEIQERAINRLVMDFKSVFSSLYEKNCCNPDCDIDEIICEAKDFIARALLYSCGIEIMSERLFSERINYYTTVSKPDAEALRDEFTIEYQKSLKAGIRGIPQAILDNCFSCAGGEISYRENLP